MKSFRSYGRLGSNGAKHTATQNSNWESYKNPFTPSLDELVQKHRDVGQDKTTDVEPEEFGGMAGAQLKANLGFVCVS
jgi:hypothetical protein